MDDPLINRLESNRIPTGVDPGPYYRRFLENSPRLFIAPGNVEHVEVFRVLIEKQCQEQSDPNEMRLMDAVVELRQIDSHDLLEKEIRVGIRIHTKYNFQTTNKVLNRSTDLLRNTH